MHVVITGANGLVGSALVTHLVAHGHQVSRLVRRTPSSSDEIAWDPEKGSVDKTRLG